MRVRHIGLSDGTAPITAIFVVDTNIAVADPSLSRVSWMRLRLLASLGPVSPDAILMLDELLTRRITECHGHTAFAVGGVREAAEIINNSGKAFDPETVKIFISLFETNPKAP